MDYMAIGQCTPGLIAINTATFIGEKRKGIIGGVVALWFYRTGAGRHRDRRRPAAEFFSLSCSSERICRRPRLCLCSDSECSAEIMEKSIVDKITLMVFLGIPLTVSTSASPAVLVIASGLAGVVIKQFTEGRNR